MEEFKEEYELLDKTKISIYGRKNVAFIATVCFSLIHKFTNDVPTAATDGKHVMYNPEFFKSLTKEERTFLMLHECWHVIFDHVGKQGRSANLEPKKFNAAADYVINYMLVSNNYSMPKGGLYDTKYADMCTEQVYELLPDNPDEGSMGGDIGTPAEADPDEAKDIHDDLMLKAKLAAENAGDDFGMIPGEITEYIENLTNPKLSWDKLLKKYFTSMVKNNYSFRKPNRRYMPDHILPSAYSEALGDVTMAIDMSGSVTHEETEQFVGDVHSVITKCKPKMLRLIQFDTQICQIDEIKRKEDLLKIDFVGRGGTYLEPLMQWAIENNPNVLVVFTDGYFHTEITDPKVPVIWVIHNNKDFKISFGKVIHYVI